MDRHHDVWLGLTGVQAEYARSIINAEAESLAEELGRHEACADDNDKVAELTESLEMCDLLVTKLERAIDEGIRRNHEEQMRR